DLLGHVRSNVRAGRVYENLPAGLGGSDAAAAVAAGRAAIPWRLGRAGQFARVAGDRDSLVDGRGTLRPVVPDSGRATHDRLAAAAARRGARTVGCAGSVAGWIARRLAGVLRRGNRVCSRGGCGLLRSGSAVASDAAA